MGTYQAPLDDMRFVMDEIADLAEVSRLPGYEEASSDLVDAVLAEAGKFASGVLCPLNESGDRQGAVLENGVVRTAEGFSAAYGQFVENGWNSLCLEAEYGGQGLPWTLGTAVEEMWGSANMAFELCPLLSKGATELLSAHGSETLKQTYLGKMVSGEWPGTMNLTEPQAGSDLAQIKTRAVRDGDHYRLSGQKIFITYGDHDMAENIIHLVLARLEGAPPGIKGVSLFLVPKFLVKPDGALGPRNDVQCVSLEHKLGINASPTCVMAFGDGEGAIGYLVGEENAGIACMFTMMNNARLGVGLQGVAIAERAYQHARDYARQRVQSRALGSDAPGPVAIIAHPDVRRMLLDMRAQTEAMRALSYYLAGQLDLAKRHPEAARRDQADARVALLTPVAKAWSTDVGVEIASTGIQVHGGMGFIEETGAAQYLRDARICTIYEGTNGIQANDLVGRKVARDGGAALALLIAEMRQWLPRFAEAGDSLAVQSRLLEPALDCLERASSWLIETWAEDPRCVAAGAVHYLRLCGLVVGGWLMARAALAARGRLDEGRGAPAFLQAKLVSARFFAEQYLPETAALEQVFTGGSAAVLEMPETAF